MLLVISVSASDGNGGVRKVMGMIVARLAVVVEDVVATDVAVHRNDD